MPQRAWSNKRERQYEHIKDSAKEHGASTKRAKEIAARTVNKERAQTGEARHASQPSRRAALGDEPASGAHQGAALRRGQEAEGPGALEDEQATAPAGRR